MKKIIFFIFLIIFLISVSSVTASNLKDNYLKDWCDDYNNFFNFFKVNSNIFKNYTSNKNKHSKVLFNNVSSHQIKNNVINKSLINKSDSKLNNSSSIINSTNIHSNTSNLTNNSSVKYNKSNVLFNDTLHNQSQFNKTFKGFGLDKDSSVNDNLNDVISKKLNSSEINNISNNSSKDNHINHVSEPKNYKDYIMLLIPTLLVLLGAIILYKLKK